MCVCVCVCVRAHMKRGGPVDYLPPVTALSLRCWTWLRAPHRRSEDRVCFLMRMFITKNHVTKRGWALKRHCESNKKESAAFSGYFSSLWCFILILVEFMLSQIFLNLPTACWVLQVFQEYSLCLFLMESTPFIFLIVMCLFHRYF